MNRQSQKERVLAMLRYHGKYGVRSDRFLEVGIPRAAARILELRNEGHEISSEREKQFSRYRLVGVSGVPLGHLGPTQKREDASGDTADPGESIPGGSQARCPAPGEPVPLFELPKPPSAYDPHSEAA